MQVKRFFAADMRQAMKLVRDELGADASIIANRRVAGGVELTAALDYQVPAAPARQANPALEAELRKTQSRIASAHAELSTRVEADNGQNGQLFAPAAAVAAKPLAPRPALPRRRAPRLWGAADFPRPIPRRACSSSMRRRAAR